MAKTFSTTIHPGANGYDAHLRARGFVHSLHGWIKKLLGLDYSVCGSASHAGAIRDAWHLSRPSPAVMDWVNSSRNCLLVQSPRQSCVGGFVTGAGGRAVYLANDLSFARARRF